MNIKKQLNYNIKLGGEISIVNGEKIKYTVDADGRRKSLIQKRYEFDHGVIN